MERYNITVKDNPFDGCPYADMVVSDDGAYVRYDDAQRALDAEREKAKQLGRTLADVYQQRDGLQAQLRQVEGGRAKWEDIAGLRFAGDHKFVKEMELLKVENTTLRQLVEALINTWVNGRKIHDGIPLTLRQQIDATLAAKDAGKEVPSA